MQQKYFQVVFKNTRATNGGSLFCEQTVFES